MDGPTTEHVHLLLRWFKEGPPGAIPLQKHDRSLGTLQAVTWEDAGDSVVLERLAHWHENAFAWFPEAYPVTLSSVRKWLIEQVLPSSDRALFWVRDVRGEFVGHVGLTRMDLDAGTVLLGDIISSSPLSEGLVSQALDTLAEWTRTTLGLVVRSRVAREAA